MLDLLCKILRVKFGVVMIFQRIVSVQKPFFFQHLKNKIIFDTIFTDSYTEITNFIQGYIDNEVNFNRDDTCLKQCSDFQHVEYHTCRNSTLCQLNFLDKNKTRCDGTIRECTFIESDMTICPNVSIY